MARAPNELDAGEALAAMAAGRLTAEALTRACLDRIGERDSRRAGVCLSRSGARARRSPHARPRRPGGITRIAATDCPSASRTSSTPTTCRRATARRFMPVTGRPRTRRAWRWRARPAPSCWARRSRRNSRCAIRDRRRIRTILRTRPGGSSSGSAAAVADFMVPVAFGTQTGGSIIRPASYCGVIGYKPSFNTINPAGVKPLAGSFDTVGLFARSVDDCALVVGVLAGEDRSAAPLAAVRPARVGLWRTPAWPHAEAGDGASGRDRRAAARARTACRRRDRTAGGVRALPRRAKRRAALRGGARVRVRTDAARRPAFAVEPRRVGGGRGDSAAPLSRSAGAARPLSRAVRGRDRAVRSAADGERARRSARRPRQHRRGDVQPVDARACTFRASTCRASPDRRDCRSAFR